MWDSINKSGRWQGEIWNRRKTGEAYLEWLAIDTLYDSSGKVLRRIGLVSDITDQKRAEETIWRQANYDALTELPNRRLFLDRLKHETARAQRAGKLVALLFIDLDRFKDVNDTFGHHTGDLLLIEAARRISECVRVTNTVARLGGDEFTVIMSDLVQTDRVSQIAHEMLESLAQPFLLHGEVAYVSASIGITIFPTDTQDVEVLLTYADQAMYVSKGLGRNRCSYFTGSLQATAQTRLQLGKDLRTALAAGQLELYAQPIVELVSGRVVKAEALLRWRHPAYGMVPPVQFIPIAEESNLINEIGDWVFRESARTAKQWYEARGAGALNGECHSDQRQQVAAPIPVRKHRRDVGRVPEAARPARRVHRDRDHGRRAAPRSARGGEETRALSRRRHSRVSGRFRHRLLGDGVPQDFPDRLPQDRSPVRA